MDIKKGDKVQVISGDDKGQSGEVQRIVIAEWGKGTKRGQRRPEADRVVVAGVNLVKRHQRRTGNVNTQFGIIEREAALHISNVMLLCPKCGKPTRVGHAQLADGSRPRMCRQCNEIIDA